MARTPLPSSTQGRPCREKGFSLGEALTATAVVAILAATAVPGFARILEHQRTSATIHLLTAQLASARSTAITRRVPVTLCPSDGSGQCRADRDWSRGWLMYVDPGRKSQPMAPVHVLRNEVAPASSRVFVRSSSGRALVRVAADGRSPGSNVTLNVCSKERLLASIVINNVGRVRSQRSKAALPCPA